MPHKSDRNQFISSANTFGNAIQANKKPSDGKQNRKSDGKAIEKLELSLLIPLRICPHQMTSNALCVCFCCKSKSIHTCDTWTSFHLNIERIFK